MSDLKPKRGFVYRTNFHAYLAGPPMGGRLFAVDSVYHGEECLPVLVLPEPDRDPTEAEVEALAEALDADGDAEWHVLEPIARAAWRLGARVQA